MPFHRPITITRSHRSRLSTCAALASVALVCAGCAQGPGSTDPIATGALTETAPTSEAGASLRQPRPQKIALLLPLTGASTIAPIAKALKQAAELALFDQDEQVLQLVTLDDRGTPDGARQAAEQAIGEGARLILGPLYSGSIAAAAPVARQAKVEMLAFSNDRQVAGNGVHLVSFLAEQEAERVTSFAVGRGKRQLAALVPDDPLGRVAEAAFAAAAARAGATVAVVERYPVQANGMLEPARRLGHALREMKEGGRPVEALFLPGGPEQLAQISPLIGYAGIDLAGITLLGTGGMDSAMLGRDKTFVGAWFAGADPRGWQQFSDRFARTFGTPAPRIATLAYDAVTIALTLAREQQGQAFAPGQLVRPHGFSGIDGPIVLSQSGLATRGLAVLEVQPFGATVIDAASQEGQRGAAAATATRSTTSAVGRLN
jgi:ABC-type branched-subunit amino acid transport system substrate-binding protein